MKDRVTGLRLGADDYLTKPFSFEELGARLESLPRRRYEENNPLLTAGPILITAGVVLSVIISGALEQEFDWSHEKTAKSLASLTEFDNGVIEFDYDPKIMPEFARKQGPAILRIMDGRWQTRHPINVIFIDQNDYSQKPAKLAADFPEFWRGSGLNPARRQFEQM